MKNFNQIKNEIENKYDNLKVLSFRREKVNDKTRILITITDGVNQVETFYDNVKRRGYDFYKIAEYSFQDIQNILSENNYLLLETWIKKDTRKRFIKFKNNENKIAECMLNDYINQGYTFYKSKGEIYFENFLKNNNIKFITQKTFKDCKDVFSLRFDFYLPEHNVLCEIQGRQHYEIISVFGGKSGFEDRIKKDNIKREWCLKNNIKLIEIKTEDLDKIKVSDIV